MATALTQADVNRLLADPAGHGRVDLARKLGGALNSPGLTPAQEAAALEIVRTLAADMEVAVRAALADGLRHTTRLPHDIAVSLARDVDAVALPILADSLVLTEADLLDLIACGTPARQTAIAGRVDLGASVADALVARGDETVVSTLMGNPTACIGDSCLSRALDRFGQSRAVTHSITHRSVLPVAIAERLAALVSDELQTYLVAHHRLPPAMAADLALRSRERAMLAFSNGLARAHVDALAAQMLAAGRLTPALLLRALCLGDMPFFEAGLAALAGIPAANARILIHDAGDRGFAAIYRKAGLDQGLYPAFCAAAGIIEGTGFDGEPRDMERYRARVIARILTSVRDFPAEDLDYLLDRLDEVLPAV
jgi:uncharacterized protein (DUF2336 family)